MITACKPILVELKNYNSPVNYQNLATLKHCSVLFLLGIIIGIM